jgi:hypothetical protein
MRRFYADQHHQIEHPLLDILHPVLADLIKHKIYFVTTYRHTILIT